MEEDYNISDAMTACPYTIQSASSLEEAKGLFSLHIAWSTGQVWP